MIQNYIIRNHQHLPSKSRLHIQISKTPTSKSQLEIILHPQILSNIRVPVNDDPIGVHLPAIHRALGRIPKSQRHIRHRENHHPIIHLNALRNPTHPAFQHAIPVQEAHLRRRLQPHLVLRVRRQQIQALDREEELPALGEFPDLGSQRNQFIALDVGGPLDERFRHVVDPILLHAEAVAAWVLLGPLVGLRFEDDILEVVADEFVELIEDEGCFVLVERSHGADWIRVLEMGIFELGFMIATANFEVYGVYFILGRA